MDTHQHSLAESYAAARAYGLSIAHPPRDGDMGHAKYFGSGHGGDIFLVGCSSRFLPCFWSRWIVVLPDLSVCDLPDGKVFR
jgi:hypothetical protein